MTNVYPQILWHGLGGHPEESWTADSDRPPWPIWRLLDPGNPGDNLYAAEEHRLPRNSLPRQHKIRVISIDHKLSVARSGSSLTDEDPQTTVNTIWESLARAQVRQSHRVRVFANFDIYYSLGWPPASRLVVSFIGIFVGKGSPTA
jgi:hypothetical protein